MRYNQFIRIVNSSQLSIKKVLTLFILFILVFSTPIAVYLAMQRQETRKEAGTGSECFDPPEVYRPAPYQYQLGDTHSPNNIDWVTYEAPRAHARGIF